jgi:malate dehydrogenase (oxaloacetate-decarboxylating)
MPFRTEELSKRSVIMHEQLRGKISVHNKMPLRNRDDLSLAYTPGVAQPCREIHQNPERVWDLTIKNNAVGIVSDGSAVLGLGNIGPFAALPVMEGKAMLFREFGGINAWPICVDTQDSQEIIDTVKRIAPVFGGINLEDISAPRCFEIEEALQEIGIPVFHDDQHGTAIVLLAAMINASRILGKKLEDMKVVVNGAGAAGTAISKLLRCVGHDPSVCVPVKDIVVCDSKGAIHKDRSDLSSAKLELLGYTNRGHAAGSLKDVIQGMDVFIGVSQGNLLTKEDIQTMNGDAIVLAMANPIPEIMPEEAKAGGAAVVGTGRSDFPNQVNNVLAFPGIFRGALDARAKSITNKMKIAAAWALADAVHHPSVDAIIPDPLDHSIAPQVAKAVCDAWEG